MATPTTILSYSNAWDSETGRPFAWTFDAGPPAALNDNYAQQTSHDVEFAYDTHDFYWSPDQLSSLVLRESSTGDVVETHTVDPHCGDMNHAQLLEKDTIAFVSCRHDSRIILYDLVERRVIFAVGGYSPVDVVDEQGTWLKGGSSLSFWSGQHNVEYFGNDTFFLFDNARDRSQPSRALKCRRERDETTGEDYIRIVWNYVFHKTFPGGYSEVFGDADLYRRPRPR